MKGTGSLLRGIDFFTNLREISGMKNLFLLDLTTAKLFAVGLFTAAAGLTVAVPEAAAQASGDIFQGVNTLGETAQSGVKGWVGTAFGLAAAGVALYGFFTGRFAVKWFAAAVGGLVLTQFAGDVAKFLGGG